MAMDSDAYRRQLQGLLPQGAAWPRDPEATLTQVLTAVAEGLARVDQRGDDLVAEADPRTTAELLTDWERVAGLPEDCLVGAEQTLDARRAALVTKLTARGGASPAYLIGVAGTFGWTIAITEHRAFRAGASTAGDALTNDGWPHAFTVDGGAVRVECFQAGSGAAGQALATWGVEPLECLIERLKPAHTRALFAYSGSDDDLPKEKVVERYRAFSAGQGRAGEPLQMTERFTFRRDQAVTREIFNPPLI